MQKVNNQNFQNFQGFPGIGIPYYPPPYPIQSMPLFYHNPYYLNLPHHETVNQMIQSFGPNKIDQAFNNTLNSGKYLFDNNITMVIS